jgi:hypothetical protein
MSTPSPAAPPSAGASNSAVVAAVLAWVIPGAGHFFLGRRWRAVLFFLLVMFSAAMGLLLEGRLFVTAPGQPLSRLGMLASMGMGAPYFVLRFVVDYAGDLRAASYEYGTAFLLTAGLMNLLLILDAWDISRGDKV